MQKNEEIRRNREMSLLAEKEHYQQLKYKVHSRDQARRGINLEIDQNALLNIN